MYLGEHSKHRGEVLLASIAHLLHFLIRRVKKVVLALRGPASRKALLRWGVAASVEHRQVLRNLLPIDVVFDVGANRGQFALEFRSHFPDAQIVAFEPLRVPAERFEAVFAEDSNTVLHRIALSESAGRTPFFVSRSDDSSSLYPISREQSRIYPGTELNRELSVESGRLDTFLKSGMGRSLLKIDVQGGEMSVLRGCGEDLQEFDYVYVEASFVELYVGQPLVSEVMEFLLRRGFELSNVGPLERRAGNVIQADFLFARDIA